MKIRPKQLVLLLAALSLTGCAGSMGVPIDYRGPHEDVVGTCVILGASAALRDDDSVPSSVAVADVFAEQSEVGSDKIVYNVSGTTVVETSTTDRYEWSCVVEVLRIDRVLTATLTSFDHLD